jgi:hypothetical protein
MTRNLSRHRAARALLAVVVTVAATLSSGDVAAESRREYVSRYVLLIDWINRADTWVTVHFEDPGLCRMAHSIAERHVEVARRITPPAEFVSIHPHVLLVLENAERMFDVAADGNRVAYRRHRRVMHEEMRLIAELLQADGHFMPIIDP